MSHFDSEFELHVRRLEEAEADCDKHGVREKKDSLPLSERIDKPRMKYLLQFCTACDLSLFQGGEQRTSSNDRQRGGEEKPLEEHRREAEEPEE